MEQHIQIINQFPRQNILVVGDLVLDQYITGTVSRISPEAPVPVVLQENSFFTPGGSANVAHNLASLGCSVSLLGKIGDDIEGTMLRKELEHRNISLDGVMVDERVDTIFKTRIIAQHQQVVRLDRERVLEDDDVFQTEKALPFISRRINDFDAIIVSDYGKGMITANFMAELVKLAHEHSKIIVVDPKVEHFHEYGTVTSITPNRNETETALKNIFPNRRKELGILSTTLKTTIEIEAAGQGLLEYLNIESLLMTLGEDGMYVFEKGKAPFPLPTRAREVFDVSGAGDTVIAVFTVALATGAEKQVAADIANHAAGIVVGKMGAVAITSDELIKSVKEY